jgi:membrane associated rhomboid family serine protease
MRQIAHVPRVTYGLIAANVLVFLAEGHLTVSGQPLGSAVYEKGALLGSTAIPQFADQGVAHGQWWRLLTSGFIHENLLHIGMNMLVLYWLGMVLEPAIGSVRFAMVYFASLLAGSFGALLLTPHTFTVGASGAIFGLAGCAVVEMRARDIPIMQSGLGGLILINLVYSFAASGISIGGHIGGLIGGALAGIVLQLTDRRHSLELALAGCLVLSGLFFAAGVFTADSSEVPTGVPEQQIVIPGG